MKKTIIAILVVVATVFCFCGCSNKTDEKPRQIPEQKQCPDGYCPDEKMPEDNFMPKMPDFKMPHRNDDGNNEHHPIPKMPHKMPKHRDN